MLAFYTTNKPERQVKKDQVIEVLSSLASISKERAKTTFEAYSPIIEEILPTNSTVPDFKNAFLVKIIQDREYRSSFEELAKTFARLCFIYFEARIVESLREPTRDDFIRWGQEAYKKAKSENRRLCRNCLGWEYMSSGYKFCKQCCEHNELESTLYLGEQKIACKECGESDLDLEDYQIIKKDASKKEDSDEPEVDEPDEDSYDQSDEVDFI